MPPTGAIHSTLRIGKEGGDPSVLQTDQSSRGLESGGLQLTSSFAFVVLAAHPAETASPQTKLPIRFMM